jgi:hypothetical protein
MVSTVRPGAIALLASLALMAGCSPSGSATSDRPVPGYDPVSGRLQRLTFDSTGNGRNDAVGIMDGVRVERIDVDEDEDGTIDRWEFYDANRRLEKVGFSRQRNGIMDAVAIYGPNGAVVRVEISTAGDGRFNRHEFYQAARLTRVEEDTNGDGRVDKWETYAVDPRATPGEPSSLVTAAFDDDFRGTPSRRLQYDWSGSIVRVDVDPEGDGTFSAPRTGNGN